MDAEGEEFKKLEMELAAKGAAERQKLQDQADRKTKKVNKARNGGRGTGRKRKRGASSDGEDSDGDTSDGGAPATRSLSGARPKAA